MDPVRSRSARDFLGQTESFLLEREAEHNLILGILGRRPANAYLCAVRDGDRILAAAVRTPPFGLLLSHVADPDAIDVIAQDLVRDHGDLPTVLADPASAARFARTWSDLTARPHRLDTAQRIHEATDAWEPSDVPGRFRAADERDRDVLVGWARAFSLEAMNEELPDAEQQIDTRIADSALVVWDDDGVVSMASSAAPTPNGIRVNFVYTPPELRGRGYATACVAVLTKTLLQSKRFVFLYTDLANPTSNAIYARIGYRPVCDVDRYAFG